MKVGCNMKGERKKKRRRENRRTGGRERPGRIEGWEMNSERREGR